MPVPRNNSSIGGILEGEVMEPITCRTAGGSCKEGSDEPSSISIIDTHQFASFTAARVIAASADKIRPFDTDPSCAERWMLNDEKHS